MVYMVVCTLPKCHHSPTWILWLWSILHVCQLIILTLHLFQIVWWNSFGQLPQYSTSCCRGQQTEFSLELWLFIVTCSQKRSPSIKRTLFKFPKIDPTIYCKFDLYEAVTSIKRMQSPFRIPNWLILLYFTSIKQSHSQLQCDIFDDWRTKAELPWPCKFTWYFSHILSYCCC